MIWMGSHGRRFCSSLGMFWLPEVIVSIGLRFFGGDLGDGFVEMKGRAAEVLTGHVSSVGVPSVSKMDLTNANSLPNSPASKSVHSVSPLFVAGPSDSSRPRLTHSATTQPAAHRSISGP